MPTPISGTVPALLPGLAPETGAADEHAPAPATDLAGTDVGSSAAADPILEADPAVEADLAVEDEPATDVAPAADGIDIVADFDSFYEQQYAAIHRTIRGIVLDPAAAEDLTQDAFAKAYQARHRYRPQQPAGVWLHRIAVNTAISYTRRGQLQRRVLEKIGRTRLATEIADPTEGRDGPLGHALAALKPAQRAAVILHHYHGYPYQEIAAILGIPTGTVGSRISTAMAQMRRMLEEDVKAL